MLHLQRLLPGIVIAVLWTCQAPAQTRVVTGPDGKPIVVGRPGQSGAAPSRGKPTPGGEKEKKPEDGKKEEGADKGKEPPAPKVIRRDETSNDQADPEEFNVMVGEDGRVAFEFRNQPWVELVQWLADISEKPLDWLELPGDRVNMRSPGRYTVEETRDLFNRYLLARGYTLLEIDGGLTVAKTDKINPAIVPRIDVLKLDAIPPHTFVRTSLDVGWLSADKLSEELAPMISSNGRLTALTTTNRIEAMDAAINLRQVAQLLEQERSLQSLEALAPEFKLRYLPAEEAKLMLEQFLGVEKKQAAPMSPQQMQMMQQMRNQGKAPPTEKKIEVSIVANTRQNSVIIRAPADRTAVAMEFLKRIDVPSETMTSLSDIQTRVQVFRLASLDPEKLIEIVSEMNVLEPITRVRVDKDNNALIVSGSMADRYIIGELIKRLDGSGRSFEVLPLRRLDPVEVAESISFLMGQKEEDDDSSSRSRYYYGYFGGNQDEKKETDEFRVSANSRYRQVLLWANEQEMEEVRSLLVKLGELPPPGGSRKTVRIIDASATPETYEYLKRLRQQWNRLSPNPLELPDEQMFKDPNNAPAKPKDDADEAEEKDSDTKPEPTDSKDSLEDSLARFSNNAGFSSNAGFSNNAGLPSDVAYRLTGTNAGDDSATTPTANNEEANATTTDKQDQRGIPDPSSIRSAEDFRRAFEASREKTPADAANQPSNRAPAEVRIEIDSEGNLVLISPDTAALDQLENLMLQVTPPKRPYQVFHIVHATAYWMRLNLEDYFKDLEEDDSDSDSFFRYYWGYDDEKEESGPNGLGKGNKLRFVDDPDTNTLVITGATSEQLRTISELIELWDVPEPVNKRKTRFTRLVSVKYGMADKIAETVKEAYRDLLSSNDKAFSGGGRGQNQGGGGSKPDANKSRNGSGSGLENAERGQDGGGADFSFKGKLSIGIDEVGNTLLVSAEGEPLLDLVTDMIDQLDEAARPQGIVEVFQLSGRMSGESLQDALRPFGGEAATAAPNADANPKGRTQPPGPKGSPQ